MNNDFRFKTNSDFIDINYDLTANNWLFIFADKMCINAEGFWRLFKNNRIELISLDNGHQFGLPQPVDLTKEIKKRLLKEKLKEIIIDKNTADLTLTLTNQYKIEIYTSSTGYETYSFEINNKRYIGMGGGGIAIMEVY